MEVIEPSEIIVDQPSLKEDEKHINPWIRFLARFFDYALISLCIVFFPILEYRFFNFIPLSYLLWIPIEALFLSIWGYTPGKFLLRTKISFQGRKLSFSKALRRSLLVWFKGIGLGISLVMPIAMIVAYQHLHHQLKTTWDKQEKVQVVHKPTPIAMIFSVAIGLVILKILIW